MNFLKKMPAGLLKKRFLFINVSDVSMKLFKDEGFQNYHKKIIYSVSSGLTVQEYADKFKVSGIVIDTTNVGHLSEKLANEIIDSKINGVKVYEAHEFYEYINKRIPLVKFSQNEYLADDVFAISFTRTDFYFKRAFDLAVAIVLLPIALLLILFGCILVFINSPGNVFFSQDRVGKNGKIFKIHKLRTMKLKHSGGFTVEKDDRLLFVGPFLRRTKLDELPQLFNVINGDMSLIGPRPERPKYVEIANSEYVYFDLRHMVKPGITGWAQVHLPKATPEDNLKKLEFDLFYIKNYSFLLDLKIIFYTIKVVLTLNSN